MDTPLVAAVDPIHAARWREWQEKNAAGNRYEARRARTAFTFIFVAVGLWLGLQFVS